MKLVGRVPVEPLDDERLTNIERRIVAGAAEAPARPLRSTSRLGALAVAGLAALAIGVIGFKLGGGSGPAPVIGEAAPLRVDTAARGATLDIGDARIHGDPSTVFVITRPAGGVLVELTRGKVELEVGKRGDRAPLIVRAGDTDVVVVGTRFSVDYGDGTGAVDVRVTEGAVKVVRHQQDVRVAAGQAWTTADGRRALAEVRAGDRAQATTTEGGDPAGAGGREAGEAGDAGEVVAATDHAGPQGADGFEIEMGTAPEVLRDRIAQVPDQRSPGTTTTTTTRTAATATATGGTDRTSGTTPRRPEVGGARAVIDPKDPRRDLKTLVKAQPVMPAMAVGAANDAAAMARYHDILRDRSATGEELSRAFYSIAATQYARLDRHADALKTIDGYLRRFSRGKAYPELAATLWLRVRILCLQAIDGECRRAASAYVKHAGDGPAANVARRIVLED